MHATEDMLLNLSIPKERLSGEYAVHCMISAFNEESKEALIYAEFDPVRPRILERAMERYGADQIVITSFSLQDYAEDAANGLRHVEGKSTAPGFRRVQRGAPSAYVRRTARLDDTTRMEIVKGLDRSLEEADEKGQTLEDELQNKVRSGSVPPHFTQLSLAVQDLEIVSLQSKLELKTRHFDEVHTALTVNAQELAALRAETRRKAQVDSARHEKYEDMKVANFL